jgi:hypothetical protein
MSTKAKYKIIKEKPLATAGRHLGQFCPFDKMLVGDSFLFAEIDAKRVQAMADAYGRKNGAAFFMNMAEENVCWRIA